MIAGRSLHCLVRFSSTVEVLSQCSGRATKDIRKLVLGERFRLIAAGVVAGTPITT